MALVLDLDEVELRLEAGEKMDAIAADLGVTPRTIRNRLHAADRPLATERRRLLLQQGRLVDPDWLREQYVEQAHSPSLIAEVLSMSTAQVVATLDLFGIERPPVYPELTGPALRSAFAGDETCRRSLGPRVWILRLFGERCAATASRTRWPIVDVDQHASMTLTGYTRSTWGRVVRCSRSPTRSERTSTQ